MKTTDARTLSVAAFARHATPALDPRTTEQANRR
jgi:hypothetical protein